MKEKEKRSGETYQPITSVVYLNSNFEILQVQCLHIGRQTTDYLYMRLYCSLVIP